MAIKYDSNFAEGDLFPSSVVNNMIDSIKENEINIDKKIDKVDGKGLSTNDYTDEEKQKNANNAKGVANNAASIAAMNLNKADNSALIDYVKFTDYASEDIAGVVKVRISKGIGISPLDQELYVNTLTTTDIINRTNTIGVFPMSFLNTIVKAALTDSKRISNMTDSEKENARDVIGAEQKTKIVPCPSEATTMTLLIPDSTKFERICDHDITAITLDVTSQVPVGYEFSFTFQSGATATTITYSAGWFKFVGVDCDTDGDFIASANTNYEVSIRNMSTNTNSPLLVARVGVY